MHGDVRPENILVRTDGAVWIIDFEFSRILAALSDRSKLLSQERENVELMLTSIREGYE